jgi:hypothetical protein
VATGTIEFTTSKGPLILPIVLKSKGTRMLRTELQRPEGMRLRIVNRGRGVIEKADGTVMKLASVNTAIERVNHIPALSILDRTADPSTEIKYVGPASVNGRPAGVISLAYVPTSEPRAAKLFRSTTQTLFYVDQATQLLTKMEYRNFAENDTNLADKVEVFFTDYQVRGEKSGRTTG